MIDSPNIRDRFYLALYARDGISPHSQAEDRYHWALLAIPSTSNSSQATRFHARDYFTGPSQTHWIYEEIHVSARVTPKLLSKTYIGDVVDNERLYEVLRDTPIRQQEWGWNCVDWVSEAVGLVWDAELLEGGRLDGLESLKGEALRAADRDVERREGLVRALL